MIELNLIPDVKRELINTHKMRAMVISIAIIAMLAAAAVTVLLAIAVFVWQNYDNGRADRAIREQQLALTGSSCLPGETPETGKDPKVACVITDAYKQKELVRVLTIQNQVKQIAVSHDSKTVSSRIFSVIAATNPPQPNNVKTSTITLDATAQTLTIEAQTLGGYQALETYNKTLAATWFGYTADGGTDRTAVQLASEIVFGGVGYARDPQGQRVLSFTVTFKYAPEFFQPSSKNGRLGDEKCVTGNDPGKDCADMSVNVTDSYVSIPRTLFETKATPEEGEKQ
ncbi:MAG: hypothetical protein ACSLEY_04010 [Candidatus Saccharimonadales bacterium]